MAGLMKILTKLWESLTYSAYEDGKVKLLLGRESDPDALALPDVPAEMVDAVLTIICHSFDIPECQKYCLRLDDNLGDIYRACVRISGIDNFEYERLILALEEEWVGKFDWEELAKDIDVTVGEVIAFVARKVRVWEQEMKDLNLTPLEQRILKHDYDPSIIRCRRTIAVVTGVAAAILLVGVAWLVQSWQVVLVVALVYVAVTLLEKVAYANAVLGYKSLIRKLQSRIEELEAEDGS